MSDWEELQVALNAVADACIRLVDSIAEAIVKTIHPVVESTATVLDDTLALPEPSYPDERKQAMECEREERGEM